MDELFKYMMIMVAIVIIILLLIFAIQHMPNQELNKEQKIVGEKLEVVTKLENLCRNCLNKGSYDQDCFIVDLSLKSDNITEEDFNNEKTKINLSEIIKGDATLKVYSKKMVCYIKVLN
ncbi:MAG: hypothetical protein ACP5OZ_04195 [Candidatus Woesearchaeota archaeon]